MRRIAPDVERLMWLVAENRDPKAIADFEARFPDLKLELAKHIAMVSGLKGAARKAPPREIPRFTPRTVAVRPAISRPTYLGLALALCVVAFATYTATVSMTSRPPQHEDPPIVAPPPVIGPKTVSPMKTLPNGAPNGPDNPTGQGPSDATQVNPSAQDDPGQKLVTAKGRLPLQAAIVEICNQAGLTAEFPPSMPTTEVVLDFRGVPAMVALQALGEKYGFTALPQERGSILVLPVRPDGASDQKPPSETGVPNRGMPVEAH